MEPGKTVCVTGASGYIGSHVVQILLQRGYTVHGTVQHLDDEAETRHLQCMDGAQDRLKLFQMDLLDYDSILAAVHGVAGVLHLASPLTIGVVRDPERELIEPAVKGTVNVLRAAKECGLKRVVVTSSVSSMVPNPGWPADVVIDEKCWLDLEYCKRNEIWYPLSKALAEKAAWEFAGENGMDVAIVNPGTVMGPIIPPAINASMGMVRQLLQGCSDHFTNFFIGPVHVKDVALAHILLHENPAGSGRHLCIDRICHWSDFAAKVAELYPEYKIASFPKDTQPGILRAEDPAKKLIALGMRFIPMEQIIKDAVESLKSKGYI
ncbi:putative cinnamoyl-CoA reductase [Dioscorea sansibarensis]